MKFLFDNNLSPSLARAIQVLSVREQLVECVLPLQEIFPASSSDLTWISELAKSGEAWSVLSIDKFKKGCGKEREALLKAGVIVYVLDPQWSSHQYWSVGARMVEWWPLLLKHLPKARAGIHRVPWKPSTAGQLARL